MFVGNIRSLPKLDKCVWRRSQMGMTADAYQYRITHEFHKDGILGVVSSSMTGPCRRAVD